MLASFTPLLSSMKGPHCIKCLHNVEEKTENKDPSPYGALTNLGEH
jgi:hypothetical protein